MQYLVYRHGSNAANQPMTQTSAVAIVEADSIETAREIAEENVNCYANQHLELVSQEDCDTDDWNSILEDDARLRDIGEESIIYT